MQPALLGDYLGHPIEMIEHGGRRIFIPSENHHEHHDA
jgi:iron complex transport system ATP-binding protein